MASYADGKILSESSGPVTTVIINRPEVRNALDNQAARGLAEAFRDFAADEGQRVAVLTGAEGAFCAGADLKEVATDDNYLAWAGDADGPTHPTLEKPVIAAVEGHACAGGLGVALWCDIRVVDETAVFGVFSRRWGVPMSDGTTVRLPRLIGMARALDMLITGRAVGSEEALQWGLASRLAPKGQARQVAEELAARIAEFPQVALRSDRQSAYMQNGRPLEDAIRIEKDLSLAAKRLEAGAGAARFAAGEGRHGSFPK
ncbi:MAG: crotonase/enoyl-CoA hydratase family protein [Alphaproteobacteria bacterium]|jgi:enoyl-CoA hydratase|nr:crotonase/enoyl-CoA hydratase family protein [Alphaproteobacteria bacterium]MDP6566920.1 crotonase/enoyl-CoA hydratase family protein [Alphaproteobacteria bacterium]MDP6813272.1 crotonase/enoyl-CoA hydratase family protein [Alphaproteobacteria bacterium]